MEKRNLEREREAGSAPAQSSSSAHPPMKPVEAAGAPVTPSGEPVAVLPIVEEELHVARREVVTGKVRLSTVVREHEAVVDEPLMRERVEVERVPVNREIETIPQPRQEGEILVIPVVEEVLVKRLVLKEEIRVRRVREETHDPQRVTLRREEVKIERTGGKE